MQTGQNSIAPENSLPQLGQVRLGSVLMDLTALQSQPQPTREPMKPESRLSSEEGLASAVNLARPLIAGSPRHPG